MTRQAEQATEEEEEKAVPSAVRSSLD